MIRTRTTRDRRSGVGSSVTVWLAQCRSRRWIVRSAVLLTLPVLALLLAAALEPLPAGLEAASPKSLRVYDREGKLIRELRTAAGRKTSSVRLDELSPHVVPTLLAAEDSRFRIHPGVDPLAVARAGLQALVERRIVSGASTLTQQLARSLVPRKRTFYGKFREAALALRLEVALDKDRILTEYLNRVEFGPNLAGIDAASRHYFDKPARALDLAEAAALVALVRGPSFYDPRKGTPRLLARRNFVLGRVRREGAAAEELIARAERQPLGIRTPRVADGAEHFAFAAVSGRLEPSLAGLQVTALHSVLEETLQRDVEGIVRLADAELARVSASAASVLVVDNASGDVLAYVGSPDFYSEARLGANDGARALRQPGSTLKPFVYAAAMQRLGWTPATLIPDLGMVLSTPDGPYVPANYDGKEHGPVRLRVALSNSLNLPALRTALALGPGRVLDQLREFGFVSLHRDAEHYGAAIALGDGEVRLSELAAAYSALARDGVFLPLRYVRRAEIAGEGVRTPAPAEPRRVIPAPIARQITSILADERARRPSFGVDSVLSFPFQAAAKTGTSKGFRDNWAVGYTREVTVAVWVGNFDGRALVGSSGVSGAGPIFHAVLERAMQGREPAPLVESANSIEREICPLSGAAPTPACPHRIRERFLRTDAPLAACSFHERITRPGCPGGHAVVERYPSEYAAWAKRAGRPTSAERPARCESPPSERRGWLGGAG